MDYEVFKHRFAMLISWLFEALEARGQSKHFLERYIRSNKSEFLRYAEELSKDDINMTVEDEFDLITKNLNLRKLCDFLFRKDGYFVFMTLHDMYISNFG